MGLEIKWTLFAKKELKKIYSYYAENISLITAKKIVTGIIKDVTIIYHYDI